MKKNLVGFVDVEENRIKFIHQGEFRDTLKFFGHGEKVSVRVEKYRKKRSLSHNNLLHKYLQIMSDECGQDLEDIKIMMKVKFGAVEAVEDRDGNEMVDEEGEVLTKLKSTADYNTKQMTDFIENIRDWSMKYLNCYLPDPSEMNKIDLTKLNK